MIRRPPRSTLSSSSAASDVYKRQVHGKMNSLNNVNIAQRKMLLEQKLRESGEESRLEDYLRQKLIECGWKDDLKKYCKDIIRRKGLEKITIDELVDELVLKGRATVPSKVREDLLARIKNYFEEEGY
eukprot:TRINITY_DN2111_c0_g1_i1.p1 TRINITY_DN2111_c0_g1~~TRINITY_DN2111_c0_g1_i1.p1  ORF type:complete len:128 (-),score=33.74 TRINITY_DN2111_c0_g1_i1:72-455(-)